MSSRLLRAVPAVLVLAAAAVAEEPPAGPARPSAPEGAERERLRAALPLPVVVVRKWIRVDNIVDEDLLQPDRAEEAILAELVAAQESARTSPEDPDAWIRLARAEEARGKRAEATDAWKRAAKLLRDLPEPSPSDGAALLRLGKCLVGAGDSKAAIPRLEKAEAALAAPADAAALLGRALLENSLQGLLPGEADLHDMDVTRLALVLKRIRPGTEAIRTWREETGRALQAFDRAVAAGPGRTDLLLHRILAHISRLWVLQELQEPHSSSTVSREELEAVLSDLVRLRDALPSRPELRAKVLAFRIVVGMGFGDFSRPAMRERGAQVAKAIEAEATALSKTLPDTVGRAKAEILSALVLFHAVQGTDPEKLQALCREASAAHPRDDTPWILGVSRPLEDRDIPAVLRWCEERLAAHDSVLFRLIAAKACALTGKPADALRHAEAALALDGTDGRAILMLAAVLARRGDAQSIAGARVLLAPLDREVAVESAENRACVATLRGLVLALEGFRTEGAEEIRHALMSDPTYAPAKDALRVLEGK